MPTFPPMWPMRFSARLVRGLLAGTWLALTLAPWARGHETLAFQAVPSTKLNDLFMPPPPPVVLHGMTMARLRPTTIEVELTMADSPSFRLLDPDPYQPPANVSANSTAASANPAAAPVGGPGIVYDPHFARDQPLLVARGATLLALTSRGVALTPLAVAVTETAQLDIVFHLTYPRPAPGPLHFQITYGSQIPVGQMDIVSVLDENDKTLLSTDLDANVTAFDFTVPPPAAAPEFLARAARPGGVLLAAVLFTLAVAALSRRARRRAAAMA